MQWNKSKYNLQEIEVLSAPTKSIVTQTVFEFCFTSKPTYWRNNFAGSHSFQVLAFVWKILLFCKHNYAFKRPESIHVRTNIGKTIPSAMKTKSKPRRKWQDKKQKQGVRQWWNGHVFISFWPFSFNVSVGIQPLCNSVIQETLV